MTLLTIPNRELWSSELRGCSVSALVLKGDNGAVHIVFDHAKPEEIQDAGATGAEQVGALGLTKNRELKIVSLPGCELQMTRCGVAFMWQIESAQSHHDMQVAELERIYRLGEAAQA